ncbi:NUDIX domain-containing protein [Azospirillum sp. sgz302134]
MPTDETRNPWRTLGSRTAFENDWMRVVEDDVIDAAERRTTYGVVRVKHRGVAVLPIDRRGCTRLVGQFRYPLGRYLWEIPKGNGEPGEALEAAARRELAEETRLAAHRWLALPALESSVGLSDERVAFFVAWDLDCDDDAEPDAQEELAVRRLPFAEVVGLVDRGELTDMVSVALVLRVSRMIDLGTLPPELQARLTR